MMIAGTRENMKISIARFALITANVVVMKIEIEIFS